MQDKDQPRPLEPNRDRNNDLGRDRDRVGEKASMPDFQFTPKTPTTPPAKQPEKSSPDTEK